VTSLSYEAMDSCDLTSLRASRPIQYGHAMRTAQSQKRAGFMILWRRGVGPLTEFMICHNRQLSPGCIFYSDVQVTLSQNLWPYKLLD
jgi:hypothetical protein